MLGATGYVLYIAANVYVLAPFFLLGAAFNGFGAAILWTAQGVCFIASFCNISCRRHVHRLLILNIFCSRI
jgi:hypothetical protein